MAAVISIRLFVVAGSPPETCFSRSPERRIAAQPPGPGFPEQAPSVKISTDGFFKVRKPRGGASGVLRLEADFSSRDALSTLWRNRLGVVLRAPIVKHGL
jgi:hypothetical protein